MSTIGLQQSRQVGVAVPTQAARLDVVPLANAVGAVALVAYLICAAFSIVAPEAFLWVAQSWFHGLTLAPLRPDGAWFRPGEFLFGLVTFGGAIWAGTAVVARLYNAWAHH